MHYLLGATNAAEHFFFIYHFQIKTLLMRIQNGLARDFSHRHFLHYLLSQPLSMPIRLNTFL